MRSVPAIIGRFFIILFCLWHMTAVAVLALPWQALDPYAHWMSSHIGPYAAPYVYLLSQWQQWNLFSPDPLRRVTTYVVQVQQGKAWRDIAMIDNDSYPRWQHATHFKMFGEMLENDQDNYRIPIVERFLQSFCTPAGLPPGSVIRLFYHWYVIPIPDESIAKWARSWRPGISADPGIKTICPFFPS